MTTELLFIWSLIISTLIIAFLCIVALLRIIFKKKINAEEELDVEFRQVAGVPYGGPVPNPKQEQREKDLAKMWAIKIANRGVDAANAEVCLINSMIKGFGIAGATGFSPFTQFSKFGSKFGDFGGVVTGGGVGFFAKERDPRVNPKAGDILGIQFVSARLLCYYIVSNIDNIVVVRWDNSPEEVKAGFASPKETYAIKEYQNKFNNARIIEKAK